MSVRCTASCNGSIASKLHRGVHRSLRAASVTLMGEQSRQRLQDQLAEAFAFREQPLLEGGLCDVEAGEQVPLVEGRRLGQCLRSAGE